MKKTFQYKYLLALLLTMMLMACEKHSMDTEYFAEEAVIIITEPAAGAAYRIGDSVRIKATAIYKQAIHGYDLTIRKVNDTTKHYFTHVHEHNDTLHVDHKWKNTLTGPLEMEAELIFYLDHDGTTGTKKAIFRIE